MNIMSLEDFFLFIKDITKTIEHKNSRLDFLVRYWVHQVKVYWKIC